MAVAALVVHACAKGNELPHVSISSSRKIANVLGHALGETPEPYLGSNGLVTRAQHLSPSRGAARDAVIG